MLEVLNSLKYYFLLVFYFQSIYILHEFAHNPNNNVKTSISFNFYSAGHIWKDWREGDKELRKQYSISNIISGLSFLIGSFLVIIGKYYNRNIHI